MRILTWKWYDILIFLIEPAPCFVPILDASYSLKLTVVPVGNTQLNTVHTHTQNYGRKK